MVAIRTAKPEDAEAYARLQGEEWDGSMAAAVEKIRARIEMFSDGVLVAEHNGQVVGCTTFIRLDSYDVSEKKSWEELTDNGWCTTHTPGGRTMFGVDLSVSRRAPRSTAPLLFAAGIELLIRMGIHRGIWGGRIPRYHRHADSMRPEEYVVARTKRGRYIDPEVELYSKIPGVEMLGVVPNYFKDWESLDNGVMFAWSNPVRRLPFLRPFRRQVLFVLQHLSRRRRKAEREAAVSGTGPRPSG